MRTIAFTLLLPLCLGACGGEDKGAPETSGPKWILESDLPNALGILDLKDKKAGDEVTVVGRVRETTRGYVAFMLVDDLLDYCGRNADEDCGCNTPWDYCCIPQDKVASASMFVEFHDEKGNPIKGKAEDLRLLDLVAVRGTLQKNETGGMILVAKNGWYRRERPKLGDHVKWPTN